MYIKKLITKPLLAAIITSQCMTVMGGTWVQPSGTDWAYRHEDGTYQKEGWFRDPADLHWYYLNKDGIIQSGWVFVNEKWYFMSTLHDGTFGQMLANRWAWIDGYCYYFESDGKLAVSTTTADGFKVDVSGHWMENNTPVYAQGKGYPSTEIKQSAGPGGGGNASNAVVRPGGSSGGGGGGGSSSGGGGGGGGSSVSSYYRYTVLCVDEDGNVLQQTEGRAKRNSFVTIHTPTLDGYDFVDGKSGKQKLTENGSVFQLTYRKTAASGDDNTDKGDSSAGDETVQEVKYGYTIQYLLEGTDEVLHTASGTGKKNSTVSIKSKTLTGYEPATGNVDSFTLTEDGMVIKLYYREAVTEYSYRIKYVADDKETLGEIKGKAPKLATVSVPEREFDGYTKDEDQEEEFLLDKNGKNVEVRYSREADDASESEPDHEITSKYTIKYIDSDTNDVIYQETGNAPAGTVIVPDLEKEGYAYAADYEFTVGEDGSVFEVYMVKEDGAIDSVEEVEYTVTCVDENGTVLKVMTGKVTVGNGPVSISPEYVIDGYVMTGKNTFEVYKDGPNVFELTYEKEKENLQYTVYCYDIDTGALIGQSVLAGEAGEEIDISDIAVDGYEKLGNPPDSVTVSGNAANNSMKLYFKKIVDIPEKPVTVKYTIQYRDKQNHETKIFEDFTGTWTAGEKLPVYFVKEINTKDGKQWRAVGENPRIFNIRNSNVNTFLIEYENIGEIPVEDTERNYSIKYVAEDTGSVLGVTTGEGKVGDVIPYRNTFLDYGFADATDTAYTITDALHNEVEVPMKRNNFPGPEKDPEFDAYLGSEWTAFFIDTAGNDLLPVARGFTVKGDRMYIDYPDTIEKDGVTYRAKVKAPYIWDVDGIVYRQILIEYETGDPSEVKLQTWKDKAQEKKDEFYKTTPYSYYLNYKETNSWNDIGLVLGVEKAGGEIPIPAKTMDGYEVPETALGDFTLDADGKTVVVQYNKPNGATSKDYYKKPYTIKFEDKEGNQLFKPYSGYMAFREANGTELFNVYYPKRFYDAKGNLWEADEDSPRQFVMNALDKNEKTVTFHRVYENQGTQFIVESNDDINRILSDFASHTFDAEEHSFYVIGKGYDTAMAEVSDTVFLYNLANYSNTKVDTFELNGETYTVSLIGFRHKWDAETCVHDWETVTSLPGSCAVAGETTVRCKKCGKEETVINPAVGHTDHNHDAVCDVCNMQLYTKLGDQISVIWDSGALGLGKKTYNFRCVDDNYNGTGKHLFVAETDLTSDIYGTYTNAGEADFGSSLLKAFLNDQFGDGLSVGSENMQQVDGGIVTMLTKEEYDRYKAAAENNFLFPEGTYLTRTTNGNQITLTNGTQISKDEAANYAVRPAILLNASDEKEGYVRSGHWKVGDLQSREINGKTYLFRCVNANYKDKTNTDKSVALFLCESVIPADEGMDYEENDGPKLTRFFGENNNYRYSDVNAYLTDHIGDDGNLLSTNIGIAAEYTGSTRTNAYQSLDISDLTRYTRSNPQVMYSKLFVPSVEEAVAMKDYLWKLNGASSNNADDYVTPRCDSYWLRTPVHGTDDMIYTVNMMTGAIEPKLVKQADENNYSSTGIRPMYIVEQAY